MFDVEIPIKHGKTPWVSAATLPLGFPCRFGDDL